MKRKQGFAIICLSTVIIMNLLVSACGPGQLFEPAVTATPTLTFTPTFTPSPTATLTPVSTPTPAAGMGIPLGNGSWMLSLEGVRTAKSLKMDDTTFTLNKEDLAFLIVDVTIRSLDPTRAMKISLDNVAILDADKNIQTATGGGSGDIVCAECGFSISKDVGKSEASGFGVVRANGRFSIRFFSFANEDPISFVFIVSSEKLNQEWQLQFKDIPPMSFKLGDKADHPLTTETTAQDSPLPQECRSDNLKTAQTTPGLIYQQWAENKLATNMVLPTGGTPVELCTGFAYNTLQIAPDGGLLLMAGQFRGWTNLYIVEPDGKVTSLVRNALAVSADFVPGTNYALVSVTPVAKEGRELYLYDREQRKMSPLYEGKWMGYRIFPAGIVLVNGTTAESFDRFEYMGPLGVDKLPALKLPEGTSSDEITPDGKYLLYTDYVDNQDHLFISNLDGSDKKELMSGDIPYGDRVLSPDGNYLLLQQKGTGEYMSQASLYDITAGSSQSITRDSNSLKYSFSPDGKWVVAVGTLNREEGDKAKTQKQTLYLFSMTDKKVVKEIEGEIVNYFFSPDGASLAYTLKNEDETLTMSLIDLAALSEQSLGQGLLTGWTK